MLKRLFYTGLVLSVFALGTWAQTPHQHPNATVVDGARNPELIPDSTAYRLWLVAVSLPPNSSEQQRTFQRARLNKLELTSEIDSLQLLPILTDFKTQYLNMIALYNEAARATLAQGGIPDQKLFLQQRDDLVSATRAAITQRLTPEGAASIDAHVREQKSHMHLQMTGVGQ